MLSAGHCSSLQNYNGSNILTNLGSYYGASGDIRVFQVASGHTVSKTFRASSFTDIRTQTAPATPPVNGTICKTGMTTGYSCSTVAKVGVTVTYRDGTTVGNLIKSSSKIMDFGDSGAPAYFGSTPYGITSAFSDSNTYFSNFSKMLSALRTSVYT